MPIPIPTGYYDRLAQIESNNRPYVKASSSSASGLFQFIKSTWISLGGTWGPDRNAAFGGLRPSVAVQRQMIDKFTQQNAGALQRAGIAINKATLYAAHFLGVGGARNILKASPNTPIEQVTSLAQRRANPTILKAGSTVSDFFAWLERKTGDAVTVVQGSSDGNFCPSCKRPL